MTYLKNNVYWSDPAIRTSEFLWLIVKFFNLVHTGEYLCLHYMTYPNGVKRTITLGEDEAILRSKHIQMQMKIFGHLP
jgi:hypothetical protein